MGSLSDPDDLPGLAHFLEHMLFYSSEKYPQEDAYSKFVSEHGGSTNAFTSGEQYHWKTLALGTWLSVSRGWLYSGRCKPVCLHGA